MHSETDAEVRFSEQQRQNELHRQAFFGPPTDFPDPDSMLAPVSVNDRLPDDGQWVLAHYLGDNWGEDEGQYWIVAKFVRGYSKEAREALPDFDVRKRVYNAADERGNNCRPFFWQQHGPGNLVGQDVDYWMELPTIPTESTTP